MTDIRARLANALRESLAPWMTGFCDGIEADVNPDALLLSVDELSDEIAGELLSLPGIAIVDMTTSDEQAQDLDKLLAVATIYVDAFKEEELMTLPERLRLQEIEDIIERRGRRY